MAAAAARTPRDPVFVGGTGRCGTHAVASLAAAGGEYALAPAELRVHADLAGLPAFVRGDLARRRLVRELLTHWWRHDAPWDPGAQRGAHRIAPRSRYLGSVASLALAPPGADRARLASRHVSALLDPLAPAPGAWIEKSPPNCAAAGFLLGLFPRMRLIHVVRDGRDVACSLMRVPWGPDGFDAALALWERELLAAHRGALELPPERVHAVSLEALVDRDRDRSLARLADFLGLEPGRRMRSFFAAELRPEHARLGRWRADLPRSRHAGAIASYRSALARLRAAGVRPLPVEDRGRPAARPRRAASSLDPWAATTALRPRIGHA